MTTHRLPVAMSHEEMLRARRKFTEQVVLTILFTVVQAWATVAVVILIDASGVLAVAAALVLSAGLMAVYDSWTQLRASGRELRDAVVDSAEADATDSGEMPLFLGNSSSLVRL